MNKFKIGDRVVVVRDNHPVKGVTSYVGQRGEVIRVFDGQDFEVGVVLESRSIRHFDSSELEFEHIYDTLSSPAVEVDSGPEDAVNHPSHYTSHPSGVECIEITKHMGFLDGNAMKYLWRYSLKNGVEDLYKCRQYLDWLIEAEEAKRG